MANVWITGARGFIGRHLAKYLYDNGHKVAGLGHGSWMLESASYWGVSCWLNGNVNESNLQSLLEESGLPDVIYHLAGGSHVGSSFRSPAEDFGRTVDSTISLLEWVRKHAANTPVICASSAAVYGDGHVGPIAESTPLTPYSPYGFHKAIMELLCESYATNFNLNITVIRFFSVFGPYLEKQLMWDVCSILAKGVNSIALAGNGEELRDWLYIDDAVRLLDMAREKNSPEMTTLNGGTGSGTTVESIVSLICKFWDGQVNITFTRSPRRGDPKSLIAEVSHSRKFGFGPRTTLEEGVQRTVKWCKERLGG